MITIEYNEYQSDYSLGMQSDGHMNVQVDRCTGILRETCALLKS